MVYSASKLAKKLDISRSYLYYIKDNADIDLELSSDGKVIWSDKTFFKIKDYIKKMNTKHASHESEAIQPYKTIKINNRRYLGNKYKLLPFILDVVKNECTNISTVADIFAGTGAVASAFASKKIITNDIMYSNYICHLAWFGSEPYSKAKITDLILQYNQAHIDSDNYMSDNFADTYFSLDDCRKIGYIRQDIEDKYNNKKI